MSEPTSATSRRPRDIRPGGHLGSLLVAVLLLAGCGQQPVHLTWTDVDERIHQAFPDVPSIDTAALSDLMGDPARSLVLLDAREPDEFAVSHLRGALRVTSPDHAEALLSGAPKDATIVAYCSVGYRSAHLVAELRDRGRTDVRNLDGSIFRWANEDRPLFRGDIPVHHVHPFDDTWGVLLETDRRAYSP